MAALKQKITPCLWFDNEAEDAAKLYTAVFANSQIKQISRYTEAGREIHGKAPGSVMVVEFELDGQTFTALNGGPLFKFSEAVSFQVMCDTQERNRSLLDPALRGRPGKPMRLAQGPVRPVLADRAFSVAAALERRRRPRRQDHGRRHADEEIRSGGLKRARAA